MIGALLGAGVAMLGGGQSYEVCHAAVLLLHTHKKGGTGQKKRVIYR